MERQNRIIVPTAVPSYTEKELLVKFNKLKSQYDKKVVVNDGPYDDEYMKEQDLKSTMENFNFMVTGKLSELRGIKENIMKLTTYKKDLGEILISMRKTEKNYVDVYQKSVLCSGELLLETPKIYVPQLLSGDLRGKPDDKDMVIDPVHIRGQLFTIKPEYINSLCDIYEKVDDKIENETLKMKKITDFLDIYKKTIESCDTHKKVLSKYNCTICFENEVKMCIQPCGHTFCTSCTEKLTTRCFACNGAVTAKVKMYLLGKDDDDDEVATTGTRGNGDVQPANNGLGLVGQLLGFGQRIV
jgi:hypothetical protein